MNDDFILSAVCPNCKRRIFVIEGENDERCPECGQFFPRNMRFRFLKKKELDERAAGQKNQRSANHDVSPKCDIVPGTLITVDKENNKQFIVIMRKNGKYICMRVIAENGRDLNPRYVHKLDDGNLALLDGVRTINHNEIIAIGVRYSDEITDILIREYQRRIKRAKVKQQPIKSHVNPVDNGMNSGNAWNGIKSVKGYIKVFRG